MKRKFGRLASVALVVLMLMTALPAAALEYVSNPSRYNLPDSVGVTVDLGTQYQLVTSPTAISAGGTYLLVAVSGSVSYIMSPANGSSASYRAAVAVAESSTGVITGDHSAEEWTINFYTSGSSTYWRIISGSKYLSAASSTLSLATATGKATNFTAAASGTSGVTLRNSNRYYACFNNAADGFYGNRSYSTTFYLYQKVELGIQSHAAFIGYQGVSLSQTIRTETNAYNGHAVQLEVLGDMSEFGDVTAAWSCDNADVASIDSNGSLTFTGEEGTAMITLAVSTVAGGTTYTSYDYMKMTVSSSSEQKPYSDKTDTTNFPNYPDGGSVSIDKYISNTTNYYSDGLARIELSVTGIPSVLPIDVVLVIDVSSSMNSTVGDSTDTKLALTKTAATTFASSVLTGTDNRLAVLQFCSYDASVTVPTGGNSTGTGTYNAILTGTTAASGALVGSSSLSAVSTAIDGISGHSGTNYDYALSTAKDILSSAKLESSYNRNQIVVFMTDGLPGQMNGYSWGRAAGQRKIYDHDGDTTTSAAEIKDSYWELVWSAWMAGNIGATKDSNGNYIVNADGSYNWDGTDKLSLVYLQSHSSENYTDLLHERGLLPTEYPYYIPADDLYNGSQCTATTAEVTNAMIAAAISGHSESVYSYQLKDILGAEIYTVAFGLSYAEDAFSNEECQALLQRISSGDGYNYAAENATDFANAFEEIAEKIHCAGTAAYVVDTMGTHFDLQTSSVALNSGSTFSPTIVVSDGGTVLETVTFNADGSEAYSSVKSGNIIDADGNIVGEYFTYCPRSATINGVTVPDETFIWNVATITTHALTLSYDIYLTGSMEGTAANGIYPTNSSAVLTYYNYLDVLCQQTFPVPTLPWGKATISYQFYLVNDSGEPVNKKGQVIPFANRVIVVPETVYVSVNNTAPTETLDAAAIAAGGGIPEGYTVFVGLDGVNPQYIVSTSTQGASVWDTATVYGAGTVQYRSDFSSLAVAFPIKFTASVVSDTVVIDYGLPVEINVLDNDLAVDSSIYGIGTSQAALESGATFFTSTPYTATSLTGTYGTISIFRNVATGNDELKYTPTTDVRGTETFWYCAGHSDDGMYLIAKVTVIPATNVYYEDNFTGWITYSGNWTSLGTVTATENGVQDSDRPGSLGYDDANNIYGYDPHYEGYKTYSYGSAHSVTASSGSTDYAEFEFSGTGFDIISKTDATSGIIVVLIYSYNEESGTYNASPMKQYFVNNYYSDGTLYQIPVISVDSLTYSRYKVKIGVVYQPLLSTHYNFVLDAIRIYDPIDPDGTDATAANNAYSADKELNPLYYEIRDLLIEGGKLIPEGIDGGLVYVDGNNASELGTLVENLKRFTDYSGWSAEDVAALTALSYANAGPNNEVYLLPNQTVAFTFNTVIPDATAIHIAAKAPQGTNTVLSVSYATATVAGNVTTYTINNTVNKKISTATELYYNLSSISDVYQSDSSVTIVITNTGAGILSLTNLKITSSSAEIAANGNLRLSSDIETVRIAAVTAMLLEDGSLTEGGTAGYSFYSGNDTLRDIKAASTTRGSRTMTVVAGSDVTAFKLFDANGSEVETEITNVSTNGKFSIYTVTAAETAAGRYTLYGVDSAGCMSDAGQNIVFRSSNQARSGNSRSSL